MPRDRVVTVVERMGPDGKPVVELTEEEIERAVEQVREREPESVAVSLLFAYAGSQHERRLCEALERTCTAAYRCRVRGSLGTLLGYLRPFRALGAAPPAAPHHPLCGR